MTRIYANQISVITNIWIVLNPSQNAILNRSLVSKTVHMTGLFINFCRNCCR